MTNMIKDIEKNVLQANLRGLDLFSLNIRKLRGDVIAVFKLVVSCEVNGSK